MYYYVFDPPSGPKEYERVAQIKQYVSTLGIAGEVAQPQPGRTIEQLVEGAVQKRYSTIIAVGGSDLINRIASALAPHDVVFGIIPLVEHEDITNLIGTSDWKQAADQLKRRRWGTCRLGTLSSGHVFLTPARVDLGAGHQFKIIGGGYEVRGSGGLVTITPCQDGEHPSLLIEVQERTPEKKRWWQQFGRGERESPYTKLPLAQFKLETSPKLAVNVAGADLCETPVTCRSVQKVLKLIAAKA